MRRAARAARAWRRLLAGVALFVWLGGPTPGAVGSCGEQDGYAELEGYCVARESLVCERRRLRGELGPSTSDPGYLACRNAVERRCDLRFWAPECRPTQRQADRCLRALSSPETLDTPEDELFACSVEALCTLTLEAPADAGRPSAPDAGMISVPDAGAP